MTQQEFERGLHLKIFKNSISLLFKGSVNFLFKVPLIFSLKVSFSKNPTALGLEEGQIPNSASWEMISLQCQLQLMVSTASRVFQLSELELWHHQS